MARKAAGLIDPDDGELDWPFLGKVAQRKGGEDGIMFQELNNYLFDHTVRELDGRPSGSLLCSCFLTTLEPIAKGTPVGGGKETCDILLHLTCFAR